MGSVVECCTKRDDHEETPKKRKNVKRKSVTFSINEFILPSHDDFSAERERFMTGKDVVDEEEAEDAIIVPSRREAAASVFSFFSVQSVVSSDVPRQRIATNVDLSGLETWWGIGPEVPDRRLQASMPEHVRVSDVLDVLLKRNIAIEELKDDILGQHTQEGKYLLFQMKFGKVCLLSLHKLVDHDVYERIFQEGGNPLQDKLKLIVMPVNLTVNVPVKGPKDADTVGNFFGRENCSFSRLEKTNSGIDIGMISVDLYSVWSLKMLLPSVAFKSGRMVDFHLVSYADNAVITSYRAAMTPKVIQLIKALETT